MISVISSLAAVDTETASAYDFSFYLKLNKNGKDQVWFQKEKTEGANDPDSYSISINIFPLINAGSSNLVATDTVYLYWIKQSSDNVKIKITFVGNENCTSNSTTYMMWSATTKDNATTDENESENNGINFDVKITDSSSTPNTIGSRECTFAERRTKLADEFRSFTFLPDAKENGNYKYTSPLKIDMTINPVYGNSTTPQWGVDEQYVGYIKATIEADT